MTGKQKERGAPKARPLAVDAAARSDSENDPAFVARPAGAPVYYGFQILSDVEVDGFTFGKITDFEAEPSEVGDAFVIARDNSRAGLVWEVSNDRYFKEVCPLEPERWGVWAVCFPHPMTSRGNVRRNLESVLRGLKKKWDEWRATRVREMPPKKAE